MTASVDYQQLGEQIYQWGIQLGFDHIGIADIDLGEHRQYLQKWLDAGMHGEMDYMQKHGRKRTHPEELVAGTTRIITARMDYAPKDIDDAEAVLEQPDIGYISRYALGRDYHKVMRNRLQKLANKIQDKVGEFGHRVFADSAPVLEKAMAENAGLGWIGKHSNLIDKNTGSWFFLGEIYVDIPLPTSEKADNHCGTCTACLDICPTQAIIAPYQVDARLCISYLTIELKDSIPIELRGKIGNRIYGCDDCQLVCPWNKFAQTTRETDFSPRENITDKKLLELFNWSEEEFLKNTEGSAIRRIGYQRWLRNIAVAMGNAPKNSAMLDALLQRRDSAEPMVREHIDWAIERQTIY